MNEEKNKVQKGTLYLVGTPIGNLSDLSPRAQKVLREVDFIAAEDTRNSAKLLSCFDIHKELISYFEHNKKQKGDVVLERIQSGESCALITDAGMPAISDPGEDLVRLCSENGVPVSVIPGPSACVSALALSGLDTSKFVFEGFLSSVKGERRKRIEELKSEKRTIIFYEAPHRLTYTLEDLFELLGERKIALCRELTKLNEEVLRLTLQSAIEYHKEHEPRGEYVLVLQGNPFENEIKNDLNQLEPEEHVAYYEKNENLSHMDAMKKAAKDLGISKSELYSILEKRK